MRYTANLRPSPLPSSSLKLKYRALTGLRTANLRFTNMAALSSRGAFQGLRCMRPSVFRPLTAARSYATAGSEPDLKSTLESLIPAKRALLKDIKTNHAQKVIGEVKVENTLGGMRGLKAMLWEGSVLDPNEGIRFHGRSISDCRKDLPKGTTGTEMLPEAMFWLLLTGQVPSTSQVRHLSRQLASQASLPQFVSDMLDAFPTTLHPMTQFAIAVSALNHTSLFAAQYADGTLSKTNMWSPTFDDSLSLLAKLPTIAAKIHQNTYLGGGPLPNEVDATQDWAYNFAAMLGKPGPENADFQDLLRLYLALHGDHEGGNVSAHTVHLVGSALSDPFLSYSAGLQGLAGPLHGLAAQEVLRWILQMQAALPDPSKPTKEDVTAHLKKTLASGQVIPGYGHAVLRKPDPRFSALMDFAAARPDIAKDPLFQLVKLNSEVAPGVLTEHGKTKNPHPNVDSSSGVLFHHYGFRETLYYTVTFGVSRGLGPLAQLIWDRALGLPIERPKSVDLKGIKAAVEGK